MIRALLILVLLLLAWPSPPRAQDEADRAWAAGDIPAAERLYEARLAADPADATALHRAGADPRLGGALRRVAGAVRPAAGGGSQEPRGAGGPGARAGVARRPGRRRRAALDPLLAEDPGFLPALQARAQFESWAGNYDESLATYGRIQEITPEDRTIGLSRARVLSWASRFDAAVAAYDSLLRENPRDVEALVGLGTVLAWASGWIRRRRCTGGCWSWSPTNAEAQRGLARAAGWGGRLVPAERRWRDGDRAEPQRRGGVGGAFADAALAGARRGGAGGRAPRARHRAHGQATRARRCAGRGWPCAPRTSASYVNEWDSRRQRHPHHLAPAPPCAPLASVDVRMDLYHRLAGYAPEAPTPDGAVVQRRRADAVDACWSPAGRSAAPWAPACRDDGRRRSHPHLPRCALLAGTLPGAGERVVRALRAGRHRRCSSTARCTWTSCPPRPAGSPRGDGRSAGARGRRCSPAARPARRTGA